MKTKAKKCMKFRSKEHIDAWIPSLSCLHLSYFEERVVFTDTWKSEHGKDNTGILKRS